MKQKAMRPRSRRDGGWRGREAGEEGEGEGEKTASENAEWAVVRLSSDEQAKATTGAGQNKTGRSEEVRKSRQPPRG